MISVQFSRSVVSNSLWPHESQHARPCCPSPTRRVYSHSGPSSQWCHPAISSSVVPFSSCPQSLPASESFPMSQLFTWGGRSIGVSALASVLPKNTQDWSPLEGTGWISLQSKGLPRVFSNTTVQKHQFFGTQLSSLREYFFGAANIELSWHNHCASWFKWLSHLKVWKCLGHAIREQAVFRENKQASKEPGGEVGGAWRTANEVLTVPPRHARQ